MIRPARQLPRSTMVLNRTVDRDLKQLFFACEKDMRSNTKHEGRLGTHAPIRLGTQRGPKIFSGCSRQLVYLPPLRNVYAGPLIDPWSLLLCSCCTHRRVPPLDIDSNFDYSSPILDCMHLYGGRASVLRHIGICTIYSCIGSLSSADELPHSSSGSSLTHPSAACVTATASLSEAGRIPGIRLAVGPKPPSLPA